jgi:hypothetical protein
MNPRYCCIARTALGLLTLAGCQSQAPTLADADRAAAAVPAAEPDHAAGVNHYVDANDVLHVVDLTPTHTITFYESSPGNITVVERRAPGERARLPRELPATASEVFAQLRPDDGIPEKLLDADARAAGAGDEAPVEAPLIEVPPSAEGGAPSPLHEPSQAPALPAEPGVGRLEQAHSSNSAGHFVGDHGGCDWDNAFSACRVTWSGGFFAQATAGAALFKVDHYSGNGLTVRLMRGTSIEDHSQSAATIADYSLLFTRDPNKLIRIDILNASGDSFHVGGRWKK